MDSELIEQARTLWGEEKEEEAIALLMPLAKKGNTVAKASLGLIYCHYYSHGEFPKIKQGEALLVEACKEGEASACHNLGTLWLGNSPAIGNNSQKAAYYYLKARELGGPIAAPGFYEHWEKVLNG